MRFLKNRIILANIVLVFSVVGCSGDDANKNKTVCNKLHDIPESSWKQLADKTIFFGHQSVGFNILDGIRELMEEIPEIKINIVETTDINKLDPGSIAHATVGKNKEPNTKIDQFITFLNNGIGRKADVAALKFCYVDVFGESDINKLFERYITEVKVLKERFPDIKFIHVTIPLTTNPISWKTKLKKILGKKNLWEYSGNVKRNQYNELLIQYFHEKEPVFDIAAAESTKPDGSRSTFEYEGKTYFMMASEYTNDGGHLNKDGRRRIAAAFLITLINNL